MMWDMIIDNLILYLVDCLECVCNIHFIVLLGHETGESSLPAPLPAQRDVVLLRLRCGSDLCLRLRRRTRCRALPRLSV